MLAHLLGWYVQDHWFNGFVCGMWYMIGARAVIDMIWPTKGRAS